MIDPAVVRSLAEAAGGVLSEHWIYRERHPLYRAEMDGRSVTFAHVPVGAPGTIMMMEEMVAAGARAFWEARSRGQPAGSRSHRHLHHPHLRDL